MKFRSEYVLLISCILVNFHIDTSYGQNTNNRESLLSMPINNIEDILYTYIDKDNTVARQYIATLKDILQSRLGPTLEVLYKIQLRCLPKILKALRKTELSDFPNCVEMNVNMVELVGRRIIDSCRTAESFLVCLQNAKSELKRNLETMQDELLELYIDELTGGKKSCTSDILQQIHKFRNIIQKECQLN